MKTRKPVSGCFTLLLIVLLIWLCPAQAQWQAAPMAIQPTIVQEWPHDEKAFTQGFLFYRGKFYESTGLYGSSSLREVEIKTGKILRQFPLAPTLFGEGLALQAGKLIQITWKEGLAFRFSLDNWKAPHPMSYQGEGWGLTAWRDGFLMSDGSDSLTVRDRNFRATRRIGVTLGGKPVKNLNELEFARNLVWANIWYTDTIVAIDPRTGNVKRVLDCSALTAKSGRAHADAVLNGIAYDSATDLFYLTGKLWPKIFVVRLPL